jgi:hypothetical protein
MTTEEILAPLQHNEGYFPEEALRRAVAHRDEITPALLDVLRDAIARPKVYIDDPDSMIVLYSMYLLGQFQEAQAYPLLIRLFSVPGDDPDDMVGDAIGNGLGRILAGVCHGDIEGIASLIENAQVAPYVRSAGLDALLTLTACGLRSREDIVAYLQSLFKKLDRTPDETWAWLACACCDLWPDETMEELRLAWNEGLIPGEIIDWKAIESDHRKGKEECLRTLGKRHTLVVDVVEELAGWACFHEDDDSDYDRRKASEPLPDFFDHIPYRRAEPKVGRNEPCPCASGKKYKKCCGG